MSKEAEEKAKEKIEELEKQVEEAIEDTKAETEKASAKEKPVPEPAEEVTVPAVEEAPAEEEKEGVPEEPKAESTKEDAEAVTEVGDDVSEKDEDAPIVEEKKEDYMMDWRPKTKLGAEVQAGRYKTLDDILQKGELILEPEIVDYLVPDLMHEVVYIGGSPGKGGGIRRTATKMTARMHKSGRRFKLSALAIVGNGNGIVGVGRAISTEHRTALEKAAKNAKLGVIRVRRGCGSWECGCDGKHSVPFKVKGTAGSVDVSILPAPKGVGIVASEEVKKILRLAGIKDAWVKTSGKTSTRTNLVFAFFDALKNLNSGKGDL